ncbi:hypothetical protein QQX98_003529 [Neonectria punicea]|uniref:LysM domain-containing protein n=1 Tax=Neonectria punicea TaxID=979145 RepID=A0ABR1HDV6_9HYPO
MAQPIQEPRLIALGGTQPLTRASTVSFEEDWSLTHKQFVEYNPSVKNDCSGIQVGHAYCVEVNHGLPRDDDPPEVITTEDAEPEPTEDTKPGPTQDGVVDTCTSFYKVKKGDTCTKIVAQYKTFDFNDFFGVPGTPTSPPTQAAATTKAATTGAAKPSPTQDGLIETCNSFSFAAKGDTCTKIVAKYGTFDFDDFYKWKPAVGKDCSGIWASTYYCVRIIGWKPPTKTPKALSNGITTPTPIQPNMVDNCNKFHMVQPGEKCSAVATLNSISIPNFLKWNPAASSRCTGLICLCFRHWVYADEARVWHHNPDPNAA